MAKLVEILAKEMDVWPNGVTHLTQSEVDHEIYNALDGKDEDSLTSLEPRFDAIKSHDERGKYPVVTRAQWQAERDRQKGGEWKRHRGGKCPVSENSVIDVKLDTGDTIKNEVAGDWEWSHQHVHPRIVQYRIISQPQAEETVPMSNPVKSFNPYEADDTDHGPVNVQWVEAKTDQIDDPIKWRDTIIHCQAIIEDCEREIAANENRLALEGFALIPAMTPVMGVADVPLHHDKWQDGDIVRCVETSLTCADLTIGREYTICTRGGDLGVIDDEGDHMLGCKDSGELEFVRRP